MKLRQYSLYLAFLLSTSVFANVTINTKETNYVIHGTTAEQLRAQMNQLGPVAEQGQRYDSTVDWYVTWHFNFYHNGHCRMTSVNVVADINYIFPKWADHDTAKPPLTLKWDIYNEKLRTHEKNMGIHGSNAAYDIAKMIINLPSMSSCEELGSTANKQAQDIINSYTQKDDTYEHTTNYGQTEGVVFP